MFFWKTSEGGGGHFRSKKLHCRFCWFQSGIFWVKKRNVISKKGGGGGVIANPKNFIANLRILSGFSGKKRNVISKNEGGGSKAVWEFSKKHPVWEIQSPLILKGSMSVADTILSVFFRSIAIASG